MSTAIGRRTCRSAASSRSSVHRPDNLLQSENRTIAAGEIMGSVVITGVSTGIGWGTTKVLVKKGHRVFGSVRKAADAERLQKEFGDKFVPLIFDVVDPKAIAAAAAKVREAMKGETLMG